MLELDLVRPSSTLLVLESATKQPPHGFAANFSIPDFGLDSAGFETAASTRPWLLEFPSLQVVERYRSSGRGPSPGGTSDQRWRYPVTNLFHGPAHNATFHRGPAGQQMLNARGLSMDPGPAGTTYVARHIIDPYFGVYGLLSNHTLVDDVTLLSAAGMGFRFDFCGGLTRLRRAAVLKGVYANGTQRPFSISADAVHFISSTGTVEVLDSRFEGQGDDGFNVHGQWEKIDALRDDGSVEFKPGWASVLPHSPPGSRFRFRNPRTLVTTADVVLAYVNASRPNAVEAGFDGDMTAVAVGDMFISMDATPTVTLQNSSWSECRCRGAVISTGRSPVAIRACRYEQIAAAAVLMLDGLPGDTYREGPFTQHLVVTNSTFVLNPHGFNKYHTTGAAGHAQGQGVIDVGAVAVVAGQDPKRWNSGAMYRGPLTPFGSVVVTNNVFDMGGTSDDGGRVSPLPRAAVHVGTVHTVSMRDNTILYPPGATVKYDICAYNCSSVDVGTSCGSSRPCKTSTSPFCAAVPDPISH